MKRKAPRETKAEKKTKLDRREVLRGGLLIAGAAAIGRITAGATPKAQAADGQPLILGQPNTATQPTVLTVNAPPGTIGQGPGLMVATGAPISDPNSPGTIDDLVAVQGASGNGIGVSGRSFVNVGVLGQTGSVIYDANEPLGIGVYGGSGESVGVRGRSLLSIGVLGETGVSDPNMVSPAFLVTDPNNPVEVAGVWGASSNAIGVRGWSIGRIGVVGHTGPFTGDPNDVTLFTAGVMGFPGDPNQPGAVGIMGFAHDPNQTGVLARNLGDGLALDVQGRLSLSSAGTGVIDPGQSSGVVDHPAVTPSSIVLVTLTSDPVGGRRLKWVRAEDGGFTVFLSSKAKVAVTFGFLVLN